MARLSDKFSNEYCRPCGRTTRHTIRSGDLYCSSCGMKKMKKSFEDKLREALGLINEDSPVQFKHEGLNQKSAEGAHRPDKGVEFIQMKYDDKFLTKAETDNLR